MHFKKTINILEFIAVFNGQDIFLALEILQKHDEAIFENFIFVQNIEISDLLKIKIQLKDVLHDDTIYRKDVAKKGKRMLTDILKKIENHQIMNK